MREAVEGGDASSVERVAHTLKDSCGDMGAVRMAAICAGLQRIDTSLQRYPHSTGSPHRLEQVSTSPYAFLPAAGYLGESLGQVVPTKMLYSIAAYDLSALSPFLPRQFEIIRQRVGKVLLQALHAYAKIEG
jgi:hypothetical protein